MHGGKLWAKPSFICICAFKFFRHFNHSLQSFILRNVLSRVSRIFHAHQLVLRDLLLETVQKLFHSGLIQLANLQIIHKWMTWVLLHDCKYLSMRVLVWLCRNLHTHWTVIAGEGAMLDVGHVHSGSCFGIHASYVPSMHIVFPITWKGRGANSYYFTLKQYSCKQAQNKQESIEPRLHPLPSKFSQSPASSLLPFGFSSSSSSAPPAARDDV